MRTQWRKDPEEKKQETIEWKESETEEGEDKQSQKGPVEED
jgi:hypothetical protein